MNMFPMQGIKNINNNTSSYVHSVLQSLGCLDFINKFLHIQNYENLGLMEMNFYFSKEFYNLMSMLINGKQAFSADLIQYYIKRANMLYPNEQNNPFKGDPYHFLYYLLEILHFENNIPKDPSYNINQLYNQNILNQQNDDYMYFLFLDFFRRTQNSLISENFFNVEKYRTVCMNCGIIYFYAIKKILRFNIEKYKMYRDQSNPQKKFCNLSLDDCFRCYIGGNTSSCTNCGNIATKYTKICCSTKVLIIYFDRKTHPFFGDIDFPLTLNIINYFSLKRVNNLNFKPVYKLKACISYDNNCGRYFADCLVNNMGQMGIWYRFMDDQVSILGNGQDIFKFEPQMLIYELDQQYNMNLNNNIQNQQFNNNFLNIMLNLFNNNNIPNFFNMNFNPVNQAIPQAQNQNLNIMNMMSNQKFSEKKMVESNEKIQPNVNPMNDSIAFGLKFIFVPEFGDQSETKENKIIAQVLSTYTFKKAVDNFFVKLLKPRDAIKRFILNGKEIPPNSEKTLASLNINNDTIVKAIKHENFDKMKLPLNNFIK